MEPMEAQIIFNYISEGEYPEGYSKQEKRMLRQRSRGFEHQNYTLFHRRKDSKERQQVVVGENRKLEIIQEMHCGSVGGGHFGMNITISKVTERFWWKSIAADVRKFLSECETCQKSNPLNRPDPAALHPLPVTSELFMRWGIDLVGPLNVTDNGNRYIIVATEYLTRWAEAAGIPDKSAGSVGKFFMDFIVHRFFCPKYLLSDQGVEFCNELNNYLCDKLGIKRQVATAYHPQTNGLTERFNQTLVSKLMGVVNPKQNDWDAHLNAILSGYRAGRQNSTRQSPFMMMYGVKPRFPAEISELEDTPDKLWCCEVPEEAVKQRMEVCDSAVTEVREFGLQKLKAAQKVQKKQYDLKHTGPYFKQGDTVLRKNMRRNTRMGDKLISRWDGPFKIAEVLGKGCYRIKNRKGEVLKQKMASTRLKRFVEAAKDKVSSNDDDDDVEVLSEVSAPAEPVLYFKPPNLAWRNSRAHVFNVSPVQKEQQRSEARVTVLTAPKARPVKIVGDGNCLFRALSHCVAGNQEHHSTIRQKICEFIIENPVDSDELGHEYLDLSGMQYVGTWGTDIEIVAAATLLETPVYVFSPFSEKIVWQRYGPLRAPQKLPPAEDVGIFLINSNGDHFEPLYEM